jgi:hypothetical protein
MINMIKLIPWDIWAAAALAVIVLLAAILGPTPAVFLAVCLGLCAYVVIETIKDEPR